jgi:hypothetical protein
VVERLDIDDSAPFEANDETDGDGDDDSATLSLKIAVDLDETEVPTAS